ncbi:glycoside hydrolase family 2 protein [Planotetraspora thailandica]
MSLSSIGITSAAGAADGPPVGAGQPTIVQGAVGNATPIAGWKLKSSSAVRSGGEDVSQPNFKDTGWLPVSPRSTVLAGLVENGRYPDMFYSTNMRDNVDKADFKVPWWYREEFVVTGKPGLTTTLRLNGIISRADIWLNGQQVATKDEVVGAYNIKELDVTDLVRPGKNALAIESYPADPDRDLSIGWIDWAQSPPDNNMGIWRDVEIVRSGPVSLTEPRVLTDVALPGLDHADLTVKVDVRNAGDQPRTVSVEGKIDNIAVKKAVTLTPREVRTVVFTPEEFGQLSIDNPRIWWPAQMGKQPLYDLDLTAHVDGDLSDRAHTTFGIRDVTSHVNSDNGRQFVINGKPLLIRGGGWASDLLLRPELGKMEDQFRYAVDLGLNTIRTEGKLESDEFYALADRYGIMIMPGWECCHKWEKWTGTNKWTDEDRRVAGELMASEAKLLRNHPSVIAFLIGSDKVPPADIEKLYVDTLRDNDWRNPIIPSAATTTGAITGKSGMKMSGPYDWVPPNYWYNKQVGGAEGFNAELSAGKSIPTLDSLRKMLSPAEQDALWQDFNAAQYHAAPSSTFTNLKLFSNALAGRYGAPKSLEDYVAKAQLANYENVRAQFEAYIRNMNDTSKPSTGLIYWMLNNAWPSLNWHLYDYYLNPAGSYFGAKKANENLHVQYSYDDRSVVGVNQTAEPAKDLTISAEVYNLDGTLQYSKRVGDVSLSANRSERLLTLPQLNDLSRTYFVKLVMTDRGGATVSRNVYWLSTQPDVINYAKSDWYYTPTTQYAGLSDLADLAPATVSTSTSSRESRDGTGETTVALTNTSDKIAFFVNLTLRQGPGGDTVTPVTWSDNYVSIWPGESLTVTATYRQTDLAGKTPSIDVSGWNTPTVTLSGR